MRNNLIFKKTVCSVLILTMVSCTNVFAKDSIIKDETVYVNLSSKGDVKSQIVTDLIHSDNTTLEIKDKSSLDNIENLKGSELPQKKGDILLWKNHKGDISYQGNTKKEIPLDVQIAYFIDNKEIKPENLGGKTGNIKIKINLKNKSKHTSATTDKSKIIYSPLSVVTVLVLPEENFSNIKTNSGFVESIGNNKIITFASAPGMKESLEIKKDQNIFNIQDTLEITADASNFKMGPIYMVASPKLPNVDTSNIDSSIDELKKGLTELNTASNDIYIGTQKLDTLVSTSLIPGTNKLKNSFISKSTPSNPIGDPKTSITDSINALHIIISNLSADPFLKMPMKGASKGTIYENMTSLIDGLQAQTKVSKNSNNKTFYDGLISLDNGVNNLSTEIHSKLLPGTQNLSGGMLKLDKKTSPPLTDFKNILSTKNELMKLSEGYQTFTDIGDDMKGTVKFIIKTDEINAPTINTPKKSSVNKPKSAPKKTFWQKIKGFKLSL